MHNIFSDEIKYFLLYILELKILLLKNECYFCVIDIPLYSIKFWTFLSINLF